MWKTHHINTTFSYNDDITYLSKIFTNIKSPKTKVYA